MRRQGQLHTLERQTRITGICDRKVWKAFNKIELDN